VGEENLRTNKKAPAGTFMNLERTQRIDDAFAEG
jgi:hypothetical protein